MKRTNALIGDDYRILRFRQLTLPFQMAMAWYMAVDGEAWDADLAPIGGTESDAARTRRLKAALKRKLPRLRHMYGEIPFGVVSLKASRLKSAVLSDPYLVEDVGHLTWEQYVGYYSQICEIPRHRARNRWPVILSSTNDETLQDGWHRMHSYLRAGHATVPAIFYPQKSHLMMRRAYTTLH